MNPEKFIVNPKALLQEMYLTVKTYSIKKPKKTTIRLGIVEKETKEILELITHGVTRRKYHKIYSYQEFFFWIQHLYLWNWKVGLGNF